MGSHTITARNELSRITNARSQNIILFRAPVTLTQLILKHRGETIDRTKRARILKNTGR